MILRRVANPPPGADVELALPTAARACRHARHTIRGVVTRGGDVVFYSPTIRREVRLSLAQLRQAGYMVRSIAS